MFSRSILFLLFWAVFLTSCGARSTKGIPSSKGLNSLPTSLMMAWNASQDGSGNVDAQVTGYRIYYGLSTGDYTNNVDVGLVTTAVVSGLPHAPLYFAATAYDASGDESGFSNEVLTTLTLGGPSLASDQTALSMGMKNGRPVISAVPQ